KCTALARRLHANGHTGFCCATPREMEGMAAAGLGDDLLLANQVVGRGAERLGALARDGSTRVTIAIDSTETVDAAAAAGLREVLVDVNVGMPRCGCDPDDAGRLADTARAKGLEVRGVMGYEGHLMMEDATTKADKVEAAMQILLRAHETVGGDVISGGGTGTFATNKWVTELQAGSFALMDTDYGKLDSPFRQALFVWATVISVNRRGWAVLDAGLKALAMDHGNPTVEGGKLWFVSDEHTTYSPLDGTALPKVGDRVRVIPAHIDPTIAKHERMHLVDGDDVLEAWDVDLRHW
ncbi:MAG TPA: alanine racemase, partial [Acidimicrobiales bacterium]|nr:alanine racemase [Acidimicrobiales bacterium]